MARPLQLRSNLLTRWTLSAGAGLAALLMLAPLQAQTQSGTTDPLATPSGPIRLRAPATSGSTGIGNLSPIDQFQGQAGRRTTNRLPAEPKPPSDFEVYVRSLAGGATAKRLGSDLLTSLDDDVELGQHNPLVPPDYLLRPGDELVVSLWGSVDADLRTQVDRSGRITIPRVGPVMLSGVRYADAADVISRRVAQTFKNFNISVSLGQLRGVRVYVTGFVQQPGAWTASALSTLTQVLMQAGGPSSAGSFRNIQLRRGGQLVGQFDRYDLLLNGNRGAELLLQADDVVHVGPVGRQVALVGSVNRPAIFELKAGETLTDLLRMAGGFSPVADATRLTLDRFSDRTTGRTVQLELPSAQNNQPQNGDVLRAFNAAEVALPSERQNKRIRIEGEVSKPGDILLPPNSTLQDALAAAGGVTSRAYLYATVFSRESVRKTQQENYDRALRDLETQMTSYNATRRTSSAEEATAVAAGAASTSRFLDQLRSLKPSGRVVLQLTPQSASLPELMLEDGDRIVIPPRPTTVGVFGSVFNTGSYLYSPNRNVGEYLRLAGGPTKGADDASVFVIRANGSVSSSLQEVGFFSRGNQIAGLPAEPGDTIFVPEELNKTTWVQNAKDWTQILYQFGIGLAGIKSAVN